MVLSSLISAMNIIIIYVYTCNTSLFYMFLHNTVYTCSGSSDQGLRPSNLRSPVTVRIPCASLFEKPCDSSRVSSDRIKAKFNEVMGRWFKPVPSCKDVYYYCPLDIKTHMVGLLFLFHFQFTM